MLADDPVVTALARAVLDGTAVDWDAAESDADRKAQPVIQELRRLARLAAVHRQTPWPADAAQSWTPALVAERLSASVPDTWGHLRILEPIGRGSSGTVYRAWDPRLDRHVALKVLPASRPWDEHAASAIIEEGRLLARVRHPNVVTIHGAEQLGDQVGLWMELVSGRTLEALLSDRAPCGVAEALQIAGQLCSAVAAVHEAGLLHRDIKATNVIRAEDGRIVLMDFGTGRDADDQAAFDLTGTPLYLAPEVFRGEPATVRSDVYSLGVLLYRLVTGTYPVNGTTIGEVRHAHELSRRENLASVRRDLPAALVRVIERALDPDPSQRYQTAREMGAALQQVARPRLPARRTLVSAALVCVTLAAAGWALWDRAATAETGSPPRFAVLPFDNLGSAPADDAIGVGLAHEIQRNLARLEDLVLISFTSSSAFPGGGRQLQAVASQLKADLLLDGSVRRSDGVLRVHARLVRVADQTELWSETFDRPDTEVFAVMDDIAGAVVQRLRLRLNLPRRHETRPELFYLFLQARASQARRREPDALEAVRLFQQVVDQDPSYAPAWAGMASSLADAHRLRVTDQNRPADPRMLAAAQKAIELDELLAPAQAAMGNVFADQRDWARAEAAFRKGLALNPSLTTIHTEYALTVLMPLNRNADALRLLADAVDRDPASLDVRRVLAHFQVNAGLYEDAIASSRWVLERDPTFPFASLWLGRALMLSGRPAEAVPIFSPEQWAYLGYAYAVMGRRQEAEALAAAHPDDARGQLMVYCGLGDRARALDALERLAARNPWRAATWMHRPEMAVIHAEPRFIAVKRQLGLPE